MKTILLTTCKAFGWLGLCLCAAWLGYVCCRADMAELYHRGYQDGYSYIKSIAELQIQVGAKPDYIWGKKSKEKHRLAYGQQCANIQINNRSMGITE